MRTRTPALILIIVAMVLALGAPAVAQTEQASSDELEMASLRSAWSARDRALVVQHGPVDVKLADPASDGHQLGDVRVTSVVTSNAEGEPLGRLDATLTTTGIDAPAIGDETRIGVLVFAFGGDGNDQVTVQGSAHYPAQGSTIAIGDTTVRPIVGGSGRLAGVLGSAITQHHEDGTWTHRLRFHQSRADRAVERAARERLRDHLREWRDGRKEARAERREAWQEAREVRKAEWAESKAERKAQREAAKEAREEAKAEASPAP